MSVYRQASPIQQSASEEAMEQSIGLGDVVSLQFADGCYDNATVCQVHSDGSIDVLRPYVHTSTMAFAGSKEGSLKVITYLGFEEVKLMRPERVKLIQKATTTPR